jgi:enoyl-CoA hydratase/carnithine racemase
MAENECIVEVFVIVDDDGNYSCGADLDAATDKYNDDFGATARRVLRLVVTCSKPQIVELQGRAPETGTVGWLTVKA